MSATGKERRTFDGRKMKGRKEVRVNMIDGKLITRGGRKKSVNRKREGKEGNNREGGGRKVSTEKGRGKKGITEKGEEEKCQQKKGGERRE